MEYEVRTEGLTDFEIRFRAIGEDYREGIRSVVEHASLEAAKHMELHAPVRTGALKSAIVVTPTEFKPGGAGGGGFWTAEAGVDTDRAPHAPFLLTGTGERGLFKTPVFARPGFVPGTRKRHVMAWRNREGEEIFRSKTKGQRPQTEWYDGAVRKANNIINRRISRLGGR